MATAPASKTPATPAKDAKPKKEPKALLVRMDEQITRGVIAKKFTLDEMTKFEARMTKLKGLLEE